MYQKDEVYKKSLSYFKGDALATDVWINKYALRNHKGELLENTPRDTIIRLAKELNRVDRGYKDAMGFDKIMELLGDFNKVIFAGSPMFGIGNNFAFSSLGNCFVIGNDSDSYNGILTDDGELVNLMKRRAGVGIDLSHLRPKGTSVKNAAKTSTGIVPFMERYSNSTREVAQDGRRGALMLSLHVGHPDSPLFIKAKDDLTKVTGANISLRVDKGFMDAVEQDLMYQLQFPLNASEPNTKKFVRARELWDEIMHNAWKTGDPGVLFWDTILRESPADVYNGFHTSSTNPCGELPLSPYDSCRLLSLVLPNFVENPFTKHPSLDLDALHDTAYYAQQLMDDMVDLEIEKIGAILNKIKEDPERSELKQPESHLWNKIKMSLVVGRRTGLGLLGLADTFAMLNIPYGSPESIRLAGIIARHIAIGSYESSIKMAETRGSFTGQSNTQDSLSGYLQRIQKHLPRSVVEKWLKNGRRNIANLTIAPTGSISILTGTSSGIEPVFRLSYLRRRKVEKGNPKSTFVDQNGDHWEEYRVLHPTFKRWLEETRGIEDVTKLSKKDLKLLISQSPYKNSTADKIDPMRKIDIQGEMQKWIDHSISVTHNLPESVTQEQVSRLFMYAYKKGCKGFTIYREGSRSGVLIDDTKGNKFKYYDAVKRPAELSCNIHRLTALGQRWMVLVGTQEDKPYEVFVLREPESSAFPKKYDKGEIIKRKKGVYDLIGINGKEDQHVLQDISSYYENNDERITTRRLSLELRHGIDPRWIIKAIENEPGNITSFNKAVLRVLKTYIDPVVLTKPQCPECGSTDTRYEGGCFSCNQCGYSKCD